MKNKKRFLNNYSMFDIMLVAILACLGIAIKPIIVPIVHIVTGPLFIPGGAAAGGFYMLFIVLAAAMVRKPFAATLACAVQAVVVIVTGVIGSHGVMSVVTYILPGVMIDLFLYASKNKPIDGFMLFFAGMIANVTGSFLSNIIFFRLAVIPLMIMLITAALSGGLGGLVANGIINGINKVSPILKKDANKAYEDKQGEENE